MPPWWCGGGMASSNDYRLSQPHKTKWWMRLNSIWTPTHVCVKMALNDFNPRSFLPFLSKSPHLKFYYLNQISFSLLALRRKGRKRIFFAPTKRTPLPSTALDGRPFSALHTSSVVVNYGILLRKISSSSNFVSFSLISQGAQNAHGHTWTQTTAKSHVLQGVRARQK